MFIIIGNKTLNDNICGSDSEWGDVEDTSPFRYRNVLSTREKISHGELSLCLKVRG